MGNTMNYLLSQLQDSVEIEGIASDLLAAKTPHDLVMIWWGKADAFDEGSRARKILQAAYSKRHGQLTGALR